jgi:hypothetical protein
MHEIGSCELEDIDMVIRPVQDFWDMVVGLSW